jgi:hypothetical protein
MPSAAQVRATLDYWKLAAVVAVPDGSQGLQRYLDQIFGRPSVSHSGVLAWRMPARG